MRNVELVGVIATLVGAYFSTAGAVERGLVRRLRSEGSATAERLLRSGRREKLVRWRLDRLVRAGAIRRDDRGRLRVDEASYRVHRRRTLVSAVLLLSAVVVLVLALSWWR